MFSNPNEPGSFKLLEGVERVFDSHFHVIDPRFPLIPNDGYVPEPFMVDDYIRSTKSLPLAGGALVSGSFQAFDQSYLVAALEQLGSNFVGVTQLPATTADEEILRLDKAGVRAVRFNLRRGGSEDVNQLEAFAQRIHEVAGWHVELYVDAKNLADLRSVVLRLPAVSVDHLGLSKEGLFNLLILAGRGVRIKATGFGRVDFDVKLALKDLYAANPNVLMFGTDLPSTRAPRPYSNEDARLILEALGVQAARQIFFDNAASFYQVQ